LVLASGSWAAVSGCSKSVHAGAVVSGVFEMGRDGSFKPAELSKLLGHDVVLSNGAKLRDGSEIGERDSIQSGVLVNAGNRPLKVIFSDGTEIDLQPGEAVGVGTAKCNCRCTCTDSKGATKTALFPCSSNSDTCAYNGDACVWADDAGVHEGKYSGCSKFWLIDTATTIDAGPPASD
jgi:hypothetical protein